MKKTVILLNHYSAEPAYSGGRRYHDWGKYLANNGYNVFLICSSFIHKTSNDLLGKNEKRRIVENDGIKYVYVKTTKYKGNGFQRIFNMFSFYTAAKKALKILPIPDVFLARSPNPLACVLAIRSAKKNNAKCICDIVDLWPESIFIYKKLSKKSLLAKILYSGEKWIYIKSNSIIFSMKGGYKYIENRGLDKIILSEKVHHINMGVNVEEFDYNAQNYEYDKETLLNGSLFKVAYTGSVSHVNNIKILCDAGKMILEKGIKNILIMVHGSGDEVEKLKEYCKNNKITNVKLYGYIDKKNIPFVLTHSDLCILSYKNTSLLQYGGSMNKMFEYFASGKPVISNARMGYSLIDEYQCGIELGSDNAESLAASIIDFSKMNSKVRNAYGKRSRKAALDYDINLLCNKVLEIIENT